MKKYVYSFREGSKKLKNLLGGKGANLCEMTSLKLPIPSGFIVTTEACNLYNEKQSMPKNIQKEIFDQLHNLEKRTNKKFGDLKNPLLLSVRSGSLASMPGMMDTILNIGLNDQVVTNYNNQWFAYDSYRRFISMYGEVVMKIDKNIFSDILEKIKNEKNVSYDQELEVADLEKIVLLFKEAYQKEIKKPFPQDPYEQLINAIKAVFASWHNERAVVYRKMHQIPEDWGTGVTVQMMVFGNNGDDSGTGVAFTRNPATGENKPYGEYLINAQGEDVVAGVRTPKKIADLEKQNQELYQQLINYLKKLEDYYRDMQDVEFTIENNQLYILQTRTGKRTMPAAVKIAVDMVKEGLISKEKAVLRIDVDQLKQLLHPTFLEKELKKAKKIAKGLPASPGAATGQICFSSEKLLAMVKKGKPAILVRQETSPDDIEAMTKAEGVLTIFGGMTSHAAVVARGMGICCVSGCSSLTIQNNKLINDDVVLKEGDYLSLDGSLGNVYLGKIETSDSQLNPDFLKLLTWADSFAKMQVYANADTPEDAKKAKEFLAKGIGLCRTEHMFFKKERILAMQKLILGNEQEKEAALVKMEKFQIADFKAILEAMDGHNVVIRYLDPPLHEFMPTEVNEIRNLANELGITQVVLKNKIKKLQEVNPMMGHRGSRVSVTYPALLKMQTRAILQAALALKEKGFKPKPELMIPLISGEKELAYLVEIVQGEAKKVLAKERLNYKIGTMIEVPRAALIADKLAPLVDFFSFGTNDLTQMTYGFSRDDFSKFIHDYYENDLLAFDPFVKLDTEGVGKLIQLTVASRKKNNKLVIGLCGEHGGNGKSIEFCFENGLDYVSCSPYRLPVAIFKSAQLTILADEEKIEKIG